MTTEMTVLGRNPTVCAVIATYDRRQMLARLLTSLSQQTYEHLKIVVVDNASGDGTAEMVRHDFPHVDLIRLNENTGASGGNNTGLRHALSRGYELCWLLDNDSVSAPDTLERLLGVLRSNPSVALAGSTVLVLDGAGYPTSTISEEGGGIDWRHAALVSLQNGEQFKDVDPEAWRSVEYVAMTSLLLRSTLLERHGLLREEFFVFGEDIDLSLRYRRLGYAVAVVPSSRIWHVQGAHKPTSPLREYYAARNYLFLFWHYAPRGLRLLCLYRYLARILGLAIVFRFDGQLESSSAISRAISSFFEGQPKPFSTHLPDGPSRASAQTCQGHVGKILVVARQSAELLADTLGHVRNSFPGSIVDVLFLHYFGEKADFQAYNVRRVLIRPGSLMGRLRLLQALHNEHYDASVSSGAKLTILYESAAPRYLEYQDEQWTMKPNRLLVKLSQRVVAIAASRLLAALFLLRLPFRRSPFRMDALR